MRTAFGPSHAPTVSSQDRARALAAPLALGSNGPTLDPAPSRRYASTARRSRVERLLRCQGRRLFLPLRRPARRTAIGATG